MRIICGGLERSTKATPETEGISATAKAYTILDEPEGFGRITVSLHRESVIILIFICRIDPVKALCASIFHLIVHRSFRVKSTLGILPTRLDDFGTVHQQDLIRLNFDSKLRGEKSSEERKAPRREKPRGEMSGRKSRGKP
jgi:hypothetical protein